MSRKLDLTDDDLYEEFGDEELTEERGPSSVAFRILAVFFFLIAVAGLFIGMIPALDSSIATGEGVWSGSMLATVIEAFKKLFKMDYIVPDYGLDNAVSIAIPYQFGVQRIAKYLPCVVLGGIGISLIAAIVALASGKAAKVSAYIGGIAVFITYGFAFAYLFAARTYLLSATALLDAVDIPLGIIVAVTFLVLLIASIGLRKGYGLANGIVVALAMAGIVAFVYPDVVTLERLRSVFSSIKDAPIADVIILFGMSAILVFNLIVSTFRFAAKRGYPFDAVRHFVMFGFAVATACLFVFADGFASPDWEALASLPMILLLASSLAAFLVSLLCAIAVAVQKSRAEEDADDEEEEDDEDLGLSDLPVEPAAAESTAITVPAPAPLTAAAPEEPPMSEFERRMSEIAQGTSAEQPATDGSVVYSGHYTYDAFMGSLTGEEKTEFGNLFISRKYGMQNYLPVYVVGGNNDEFFSKVFIYLGKYRSHISASLLDKMYRFVNNDL